MLLTDSRPFNKAEAAERTLSRLCRSNETPYGSVSVYYMRMGTWLPSWNALTRVNHAWGVLFWTPLEHSTQVHVFRVHTPLRARLRAAASRSHIWNDEQRLLLFGIQRPLK